MVQALLQQLEQQQINYCQFNGSLRLRASMFGEAELNVLCERGDTQKLAQALGSGGFKRFNVARANSEPAAEDYLALDAASGKLVYLHLHYQLFIGAPHLHDVRLPWEQQLLGNRVYQPREKIYTVEPPMELLLFMLRLALRVRGRDRLFDKRGKRFFDSATLVELHWLQSRTESQEMQQLTASMFGEQAAAALAPMLKAKQPTLQQLREFHRSVAAVLRLYCTHSTLQSHLRRRVNEARSLIASVKTRYLNSSLPVHRYSASGGMLIALMGCDGSGKSTHLHSVQHWLDGKLGTLPIYFGSGDGPASLLRWPLKLVADALRKTPNYQAQRYKVEASSPAADDPNSTPGARSPSRLRMLAKALWALTLSLEKRSKLRQATAARQRGMVVICDRYPQNQTMGFNDGPLLNAWQQHSSRLLRGLARWEGAPYRAAEKYPPDMVVKLHLTAEIAVSRKPEMSLEECRRRIAVIEGLTYPAATQTLSLDATEPLETVLCKLKNSIWSKL